MPTLETATTLPSCCLKLRLALLVPFQDRAMDHGADSRTHRRRCRPEGVELPHVETPRIDRTALCGCPPQVVGTRSLEMEDMGPRVVCSFGAFHPACSTSELARPADDGAYERVGRLEDRALARVPTGTFQ